MLRAATPANDKVNVALIGCRSMGFGDLWNQLKFDDVNCVAMCDVDRNVLDERVAQVEELRGRAPVKYKDYRKMLERDDIDAVIIGTPDHWHCLQMVDAVDAGKDVYVEKPMGNSIEECNIMVRAAKRSKQVVQVGQQQRSNNIFLESMEMIRAGLVGPLRKVNLWATFEYGLGADRVPDSPAPDGVDYDMWLGPAPKRPFNMARFHSKWRHFWDYGGGMFSDWGVHLIDMGLWIADAVRGPREVLVYAANSSGYDKARETFDTMNVIYPTNDIVINFDMTAGVQQAQYDQPYGVQFVGDFGTIHANRQRYRLSPEWNRDQKRFMAEEKEATRDGDAHVEHARNFIDCVKSRTTPACPPEVGRAAAVHAHVANIAARIGEPALVWDDAKNRFANSRKANDYIVPEYRAPWKLPKV